MLQSFRRWWRRMGVDVVVYALDPTAFGRMIVLERQPLERGGEQVDTIVTVELDAPAWRFAGGEPLEGEHYERRTETFLASELWPESKWNGVGQDRSDAVAASG